MPNYAASEINVKKFISAYIIVQLTPRNAYRILLLIKQYRVKQIVYFHTYRYLQKRYRIYTGEYP